MDLKAIRRVFEAHVPGKPMHSRGRFVRRLCGGIVCEIGVQNVFE